MSFVTLKANLARGISMLGYKFKVASPQIMVGAGIIGLVGAGVVACVTTAKKLDGVLEKHNEGMAKIREAQEKIESGELTEEELAENGLTKDDIKKATFGQYVKTAGRAVWTYSPAIALALLSITLIVCGHGMLQKRHVAAVAAYAAQSEAFKKYRARVAEKYGDETEKLIFSGGEKKLITTEHKDENGETVQTTKEEHVARPGDPCGVYSFIYDAANAPHAWSRTPGVNYTMLIQQQMWANERLQAKGYLTLNQVLESIGIPAVREGMAVGWILGGPGDKFVDFGIVHSDNWEDPGCFTGGLPDYLLNFNCYPIMAAMPRKHVKTRKKAVIKAGDAA